MSKTKTITMNDGRKIRVLKTNGGIIISRGCDRCGHGLLIVGNTGICGWEEGVQYPINDEFLTELRSKL